VLEVIMDDSYDNLSPMVDAMRELGPEVCGLLLPTVGYSGIVELSLLADSNSQCQVSPLSTLITKNQ